MPLDLSMLHWRKELAARIVNDMDEYVIRTYDDGHRKHLGASLIGADCTRATWASNRWITRSKHSGRMMRLFRRGHREESWFYEMLVGIGATVWMHDLESGKQFRVSRLDGHFGGSLDAIIKLPERYDIGDDILFLGEFKTKGAGKEGDGRKFKDLVEKGIMLTNPQHYDQMCTYGANYGYKYSVYFSVNKNDDTLHVEVVPLDWNRAAEVERKAAYILGMQTPPPRIAEQPTFYKCKGCDHHGWCFSNHMPDRNCRSCTNAYPAAEGTWYCALHNGTIPDNIIRVGCPQWNYIRSQPS